MANKTIKLLSEIKSVNDINKNISLLLSLTKNDLQSIVSNKSMPMAIVIIADFLIDNYINTQHKIKFILEYIKENKTEFDIKDNVVTIQFIDSEGNVKSTI